MVIDIHTHAFPDTVAEHAVPSLEGESDLNAHLDGKISSLLESMNKAGIDISVVVSIATKPTQFRSILEWSSIISSDRIVPFPSVHPDDPSAADQVSEIARSGFRGLKLHPYYQSFAIDEPRLNPLYERAEREGVVVLMHTGFDVVYPRDRVADPRRVDTVLRRFPGLKLIASHFGGWEDWDEVEKYLIGREVYIDTSYSIPFLGAERARELIIRHGYERFLFGSDSPWADQSADLKTIRELGFDEISTSGLIGGNAAKLLNIGHIEKPTF